MTSRHRIFRPVAIARLVSLALALSCTAAAHAQFKVTGPDGKVTYTDREPSQPDGKVTSLGAKVPVQAAEPDLPFELRQIVAKYPATLYTISGACEPCTSARQLLRQRGIPFDERQVISAEDSEALEKLSGAREAPTLALGSQILRGLAGDVWHSYLDAAGYPREVASAGSYQYRAATPLVERREQAARAPPRPLRPRAARSQSARRTPAPAPQASDSDRLGHDQAALRPILRAAMLPDATPAPIAQNRSDTPNVAPAKPNASGMTALERLIAIERSAMASPCRAAGVIWCSVVMIMGCTEPSARPRRRRTRHRPGGRDERVVGRSAPAACAAIPDSRSRSPGRDGDANCSHGHAKSRAQADRVGAIRARGRDARDE